MPIFRLIAALTWFFGALIGAIAQDVQRSATDISQEQSVMTGKRVALVIGISIYDNAPILPNARNDAVDISAQLRKLGFGVIEGIDLTRREMEDRIQSFAGEAENAEVAFFYFAGHGLQVEGLNYLLPRDASVKTKHSLQFQAIEANLIFRLMTADQRIAIALLDACRDNPIARSFSSSRSGSKTRGLADPNYSSGDLLIGFSTAPGETAADGDGRNSPFATSLLVRLREPGVEIEQTLKRVRLDVKKATGDRQWPWSNTGLSKDFYMLPAAPESTAATAHWLNGKWMAILTNEPISDPLFCPDLSDGRCRTLEFFRIDGDGSFEGIFHGSPQRSAPMNVVVTGRKVHVSNHRIDADLTIQPSGVMEGSFKNTDGMSTQIRLRKVN